MAGGCGLVQHRKLIPVLETSRHIFAGNPRDESPEKICSASYTAAPLAKYGYTKLKINFNKVHRDHVEHAQHKEPRYDGDMISNTLFRRG